MNFTKLNIKDYRKSRTSLPIMTAELRILQFLPSTGEASATDLCA
jgi:hypothetical protein